MANIMNNYSIKSAKGVKEIEGTLEAAILAAIASDSDLCPSYGTTVQAANGTTLVHVEDGRVQEQGGSLVVCLSADGWSVHAEGSTDEEIASGSAPYLASGAQ